MKIGVDKFMHFMVNFGLVLTIGMMGFLPHGIVCAGLLSAGKEGVDYEDNREWNWGDIAADCIGIGFGTLLVVFLT
ncbi:unnamed protein product [marine sediment metagenome]|uniref:Uncharacterized protein n=1 Tax=marine sediment metagenome TaxID=412755 RepID=X0S3M4_9ZZZZ